MRIKRFAWQPHPAHPVRLESGSKIWKPTYCDSEWKSILVEAIRIPPDENTSKINEISKQYSRLECRWIAAVTSNQRFVFYGKKRSKITEKNLRHCNAEYCFQVHQFLKFFCWIRWFSCIFLIDISKIHLFREWRTIDPEQFYCLIVLVQNRD